MRGERRVSVVPGRIPAPVRSSTGGLPLGRVRVHVRRRNRNHPEHGRLRTTGRHTVRRHAVLRLERANVCANVGATAIGAVSPNSVASLVMVQMVRVVQVRPRRVRVRREGLVRVRVEHPHPH